MPTDDAPYLRAAVLSLSDELAELRQIVTAQGQVIASLCARLDYVQHGRGPIFRTVRGGR